MPAAATQPTAYRPVNFRDISIETAQIAHASTKEFERAPELVFSLQYQFGVMAASSTTGQELGVRAKTENRYKHRPLQSHTCIRVVQLSPSGTYNDPLLCHVTHLDRDTLCLSLDESSNYYDAVSYVWGESVFSHQLFVLDRDDRSKAHKSVRITSNVDSMLRCFRKRSAGQTINLWIDAICLNQEDRLEVREQVFLMGKIYSQARTVRVWLGSQDEGVATVFAFLRQLDRAESVDDPVLQKSKFDSDLMAAVQAFWKREFFTRRWILQEVALAKRVDYFAHKSWATASDIGNGIQMLPDYLEYERDFTRLKDLSDRGRRAIEVISNLSKSRNLLTNLWDFHDSGCSDARDKVVALCGFSTDEISWSKGRAMVGKIPVEYDRGVFHIYTAIARHYMSPFQDGDDDVWYTQTLEHVEAFGCLRTMDDAQPSWCPNWSHARNVPSPRPTWLSAEPFDYTKNPWNRMFLGEDHSTLAIRDTCLTIHYVLQGPTANVELARRFNMQLEMLRYLIDFITTASKNLDLNQTNIKVHYRETFMYLCLRKVVLLDLERDNLATHDFASCWKKARVVANVQKGANIDLICSQDCIGYFCRFLSSFLSRNSVFVAGDQTSACVGTARKIVAVHDIIQYRVPSSKKWALECSEWFKKESVFRVPVFRPDPDLQANAVDDQAHRVFDDWLAMRVPNPRVRAQHNLSVTTCKFHGMATIFPPPSSEAKRLELMDRMMSRNLLVR